MAGAKGPIIDRIMAGERTKDIAAALGVSQPYVSIVRSRLKNETLTLRITDLGILRGLYKEATTRGISPTTLAKSLVEIAVVDGLFSALLD